MTAGLSRLRWRSGGGDDIAYHPRRPRQWTTMTAKIELDTAISARDITAGSLRHVDGRNLACDLRKVALCSCASARLRLPPRRQEGSPPPAIALIEFAPPPPAFDWLPFIDGHFARQVDRPDPLECLIAPQQICAEQSGDPPPPSTLTHCGPGLSLQRLSRLILRRRLALLDRVRLSLATTGEALPCLSAEELIAAFNARRLFRCALRLMIATIDDLLRPLILCRSTSAGGALRPADCA